MKQVIVTLVLCAVSAHTIACTGDADAIVDPRDEAKLPGGNMTSMVPGQTSTTSVDSTSTSGQTNAPTSGMMGTITSPTKTPQNPGMDPPKMPPLDGQAGVLGCPTVDSPKYTMEVKTQDTLSDQYATACASCHGTQGQGLSGYPSLPGELSEQDFLKAVRSGKNEAMPAFGAEFVTDDVIFSDYKVLQGLQGGAAASPSFGTEWDWSPQEVAQAREEGLEVWRKPDPSGVACANCHTPDAIDVALLGYEDHAITRRARLHLGPVDTVKVVRFVHAQRRHFNISKPCHPEYRPLQPGGKVLPGDTPQEQDAAFGASLKARNLLMATGAVETYEDAKAAMEEIGQINMRTLPIGIPLPRWTEDGFNGEEHATLNDYMPPIGLRPNDSAAWYALEDKYVQDPSDENLFELLSKFESMNNDGGYRDAHPAKVGNCRRYKSAGDYLYDMARRKRASQYITQHLLRRAVNGQPSFAELELAPFIEYARLYDKGLNPFFSLAGEHAEKICYSSTAAGSQGAQNILAALPQDVVDETPQQDLDQGEISEIPKHIAHPWFTLGQLYDPGLMMRRQDQATNKLHYWHTFKFPHQGFHGPFFTIHRNMVQTKFYTELKGSASHPGGITPFSRAKVQPLLDGNRTFAREFSEKTISATDMRAGDAHRLTGNAIRAILLTQIHLLEQGESVSKRSDLGRQTGAYRKWAQKLVKMANDKDGATIKNSLGVDLGLYTTGIESLCDQVGALMDKAQEL